MSPVTHQTVRLAAGNHESPDSGMCVLELASVLAGEAFSAYPASVCPVVAAFLRCYNDLVDDRRRQDLIPCAAAAVGNLAAATYAGLVAVAVDTRGQRHRAALDLVDRMLAGSPHDHASPQVPSAWRSVPSSMEAIDLQPTP